MKCSCYNYTTTHQITKARREKVYNPTEFGRHNLGISLVVQTCMRDLKPLSIKQEIS